MLNNGCVKWTTCDIDKQCYIIPRKEAIIINWLYERSLGNVFIEENSSVKLARKWLLTQQMTRRCSPQSGQLPLSQVIKRKEYLCKQKWVYYFDTVEFGSRKVASQVCKTTVDKMVRAVDTDELCLLQQPCKS